MRLSSISITIFCHETEDKNKIISSLIDFFGNILNSAEIFETAVEGHYGNSISIIEYRLSDKRAEELADKILNSLDSADLLYLLSTFDQRIEKNKFHLRIDKQRLIAEKKLAIKDSDDVIKIVMNFKGRVTDELKEELKQIANRNLRSQF